MQKFEHQATVVAKALTVQETITMVSLMDNLAKKFQDLSQFVEHNPEDQEAASEYMKLGNQLHILEELGFCTSVPGAIQYGYLFNF